MFRTNVRHSLVMTVAFLLVAHSAEATLIIPDVRSSTDAYVTTVADGVTDQSAVVGSVSSSSAGISSSYGAASAFGSTLLGERPSVYTSANAAGQNASATAGAVLRYYLAFESATYSSPVSVHVDVEYGIQVEFLPGSAANANASIQILSEGLSIFTGCHRAMLQSGGGGVSFNDIGCSGSEIEDFDFQIQTNRVYEVVLFASSVVGAQSYSVDAATRNPGYTFLETWVDPVFTAMGPGADQGHFSFSTGVTAPRDIPANVPEPSSLLMMATGLLLLLGRRQKLLFS